MVKQQKRMDLLDIVFKITQIGVAVVILLQLFALERQIGDSKNQQSAQFILDFNKQLRGKDGYRQLVYDIAVDDGIFSKHDTAEVDSYLLLWETLNSINTNKLIDQDGIYSTFSYDIERAYESSEIMNYIYEIRKQEQDSTIFSGFETLAKKLRRYK